MKKDNTMRLFLVCLLPLFCSIPLVYAASCTINPVAEGSRFTFTKSVLKSRVGEKEVKWLVDSLRGTPVTVTQCTPDCSGLGIYPEDAYTSTRESDGRYYDITLTIHNVYRLRDQATWYWKTGADEIGQCDLEVYSFPSFPVCQSLGLSPNGNTVSWTCTISGVYPALDCRFKRKKGTGFYKDIPTENVQSSKTTDEGEYPPRTTHHDYTCNMDIPILDLGPGAFTFKLNAVIVKEGSTTNVETKSSGEKSLTLVLPQTELIDCPSPPDGPNQGYISEKDTTKTCQCALKKAGTPPGQPQWVDENGKEIDVILKHILPLIYNSIDPKPRYVCRGESALGIGTAVLYQPQFAYGPKSITMSVHDKSGSMNKCQPGDSFFTYCDIAKNSVNPKPTMTVALSDGSTVTPWEETESSGFYRYKFKVTPEKGGPLIVTCVSSNAIFPNDLKAYESKTITVNEPPTSNPVMTVNNGLLPVENKGGIVTVTEGDEVKVNCHVYGGYPAVDKVTIKCADDESNNNGVQATNPIVVKKEYNQKKCVCSADHTATGCYKKTSELTLNVRYTPSVISYKANGKTSQSVSVSTDDNVRFVCVVEGNPRPTVSIKGQRWGSDVTLQDTSNGDYGKKSTGTKKMSCKDTDVYTCAAENGVSSGISKSVSVFVECVPELQSPSSLNQAFTPSNDTDLEIKIQILGYPEPESYTLRKVADKKRRRRRAAVGDEIPSDMYNATYQAGRAPKGVVTLTMFDLTDKDSGQYTLTINNGIGDGLDYPFNVSIVAESTSSQEGTNGAVIGGAVGGAIILIIIIIVVIVFIVRKRSSSPAGKKQNTQEDSDDKMHMQDNVLYVDSAEARGAVDRENEFNVQRESDFVQQDCSVYGMNRDVANGRGVFAEDKEMNFQRDSDFVQQDCSVYGMNRDVANGRGVFAEDKEMNFQRDSDFVQQDCSVYGMNRDVANGRGVFAEDKEMNFQRDSDFVQQDCEVYGMNPDVATAYQDYSTVVPTITTATAKPRNMNPQAEDTTVDNPYEDFKDQDIQAVRASSHRGNHSNNTKAQPHPPAPASKPSVPKKKQAVVAPTSPTKQPKATQGTDDNVYSSVDRTATGFAVKPSAPPKTSEPTAMEEDQYGFPVNRTAPAIPEKNYVADDGDGLITEPKAKTRPALPSKKKPQFKIDEKENGAANNAYSNVAMVCSEDEGAQGASENEYGNIAVQGARAGGGKGGTDLSGRFTNKDGLTYSTVDFSSSNHNQGHGSSSIAHPKRFQVVDDRVEYSSVVFDDQKEVRV